MITFDPAKRDRAWSERGIRFEEAAAVFAGPVVEFPDLRRDYGERRIVTFGQLDGRMIVVVWTQRGDARHIISMRKANDREPKRYRARLVQI